MRQQRYDVGQTPCYGNPLDKYLTQAVRNNETAKVTDRQQPCDRRVGTDQKPILGPLARRLQTLSYTAMEETEGDVVPKRPQIAALRA